LHPTLTTLITAVKATLRRPRCQNPVVTDYAARYANLLIGYLNVMSSEEEVSAKDTNLNCLIPGHYAAVCPKMSFCKVDGCYDKHSTFLHPPSARVDDATQPEIGAQSAYISVGKPRRTVNGAGTSVTGLPVVPVKVRAKGSNTLLHTYAFLTVVQIRLSAVISY